MRLHTSKLVPLKCTVCGASVPRETLICEHCGTNFVLSDTSVAVLPSTRTGLGSSHDADTLARMHAERFDFGRYLARMYNDKMFKPGVDDRVDRKIFRYMNETNKRKIEALEEHLTACVVEIDQLNGLLRSNRIDEDDYDNQRKAIWRKYEKAKGDVAEMLDCAQAMMIVYDFMFQSAKKRSGVFKVVFRSVDGKAVDNSFIYKITGSIDCLVRSGIFSTKTAQKCFSTEIDYKTGKIVSFSWEPDEPFKVQEYRARPLALPKFS